MSTRLVTRVAERVVRRAFARADIDLGGTRPWDLRVHDPAFFLRLARNPAFQLGDTYMDGLWDCDAIDQLLARLVTSRVAGSHERGPRFFLRSARARLRNLQSRAHATTVATTHYDLDADLYRGMLDDSLTYTCAYWHDPATQTLADAQRAKLAMVCDKLDLQPGDRLLDIGCGFGGLVAFAAEHYGVVATGITNSAQHYSLATARYGERANVRFAQIDYRELPSLGRRFDKIASIEMIEAVGPKNFRTFMSLAHANLVDGGRFLVQAFISNTSQYVCNEWFDRYIFPNGVSPSFAQLDDASADNFGAPKHSHELGTHYTPTLLAWDRNLRATWPTLARTYDARFQRMWHFYLASLAGVFATEDLRLCQIVYGKGEIGAIETTRTPHEAPATTGLRSYR